MTYLGITKFFKNLKRYFGSSLEFQSVSKKLIKPVDNSTPNLLSKKHKKNTSNEVV